MGTEKMKSVMGDVIAKCRQAYQAKMPLIMIDTMESELVEEVALSGKLVALVEGKAATGKEQAYYEFIGAHPDRIQFCENLYFGPESLKNKLEPETLEKKFMNVWEMNGNLDRADSPACIFVIPLNRASWAPPRNNEHSAVSVLRAYVRKYTRCRDDNSPLRCSCVLLYGDTSFLPPDLQIYTEIVEVEYPSKREIMSLIKSLAESLPREGSTGPLSGGDLQELASDLAGFSLYEARRLIQRLLRMDNVNGQPVIANPPERRRIMLDIKKQTLLRNGGLLTLYREEEGGKLAAMGAYRKWVESQSGHMQDPEGYLLQRGTPAPKGVLLCGVPGCGKSEAAKILARQWKGLPLVQLNIDQLMGGLVGDSERNMRTALRQAEAMAPCILWIDELEKGFSGAASGGSGDSGTFKRVFGRLLTWMQENKRACFIFATANDISQLPGEFFRSGRFDALFSVFMPTDSECRELFSEQMRRAESRRIKEAESRGLEKPDQLFDDGIDRAEDDCFNDEHCLSKIMAIFAQNHKFLTGADIAKIVNSALLSLPSAPSTPIKADEWVARIETVANSPTMSTYGSSSANLDSIAACYLRLMRGNFVSAGERTLFKKENYHVSEDKDSGRIVAEYVPGDGEEPKGEYDHALYHALLERFPRMADRIENNELSRLCRG